jgi:hypothetical protein
MKIVLLVILVAPLVAAPLTPPKPILTADELRQAAIEVPVARIDFFVPAKKEAAEHALAQRFFNGREVGFSCRLRHL